MIGRTAKRLLQVNLQVPINALALVIQSDESSTRGIDASVVMFHRHLRFARQDPSDALRRGLSTVRKIKTFRLYLGARQSQSQGEESCDEGLPTYLECLRW